MTWSPFGREVAVVGVAESDGGKVPGRTELQLHAQAARRALDDAGLDFSDVDGFVAMTQMNARMPSLLVGEYLGLKPSYTDSTSMGGASFEAHVEHAVLAIAAGLCDVCLITYGSVLRSSGSKIGTAREPVSDIAVQFETPYGENLVASYAMMARRHMHDYGTTSEQLAEVAVTMRQNAALNPNAMYRDPISVSDVLSSRLVADPLHVLDCCIMSDGGGAIVLTSAERAKDCQKSPVWVMGAASGFTHLHISQMPEYTKTAAAVSGPKAFGMAGVSPQDIDVACLYDSFTITVLLCLEDLGFCEKGEGGLFVQSGAIRMKGKLPVNPDGGGLSASHPGMRGIFLLIEATRQLRGECGPRQVSDAKLAVAHGVGGWASGHGTVILGGE